LSKFFFADLVNLRDFPQVVPQSGFCYWHKLKLEDLLIISVYAPDLITNSPKLEHWCAKKFILGNLIKL
jgi:hypothetical protein